MHKKGEVADPGPFLWLCSDLDTGFLDKNNRGFSHPFPLAFLGGGGSSFWERFLCYNSKSNFCVNEQKKIQIHGHFQKYKLKFRLQKYTIDYWLKYNTFMAFQRIYCAYKVAF